MGKGRGIRPPRSGTSYRFRPTAKQRKAVMDWVAQGATQQEIADLMGKDRTTIIEHFALELKTGKIDRNLKVSDKLYKACMKGEAWAIKLWLTTRHKDAFTATQSVDLNASQPVRVVFEMAGRGRLPNGDLDPEDLDEGEEGEDGSPAA